MAQTIYIWENLNVKCRYILSSGLKSDLKYAYTQAVKIYTVVYWHFLLVPWFGLGWEMSFTQQMNRQTSWLLVSTIWKCWLSMSRKCLDIYLQVRRKKKFFVSVSVVCLCKRKCLDIYKVQQWNLWCKNFWSLKGRSTHSFSISRCIN